MADKVTLEMIHDNVTTHLKSMVNKANSIQSYFARVAYPTYQQAQITRWQTENASETGTWKRLDPVYAIRKRKIYAGYEYGGTKMLVGTGKLFKSVVGPGSGHAARFTNDAMEIRTTVDYAPYVAEDREFMRFSKATITQWEEDLKDFITSL